MLDLELTFSSLLLIEIILYLMFVLIQRHLLLFYVRKTARNFNQPMCKAAKTTIVEVCISHITITCLLWCLHNWKSLPWQNVNNMKILSLENTFPHLLILISYFKAILKLQCLLKLICKETKREFVFQPELKFPHHPHLPRTCGVKNILMMFTCRLWRTEIKKTTI